MSRTKSHKGCKKDCGVCSPEVERHMKYKEGKAPQLDEDTVTEEQIDLVEHLKGNGK